MEPNEPQQVSIVVPENSTPVFSNTTQISVSDDAAVMQFSYMRPNMTSGQLMAEIVMSPKHAIEFSRALDATIKKHFTRHLEGGAENGIV